MPGSSVHRDLGPQFSAEDPRAESKMAAASQQRDTHTGGQAEHRQVIAPATLAFTPQTNPHKALMVTPSPASTESLIERSMDNFTLSPLSNTPAHQVAMTSVGGLDIDLPLNAGYLFLKLSDLLDRGLTNTAIKITNDIRSDFQNLGSRMEAI